MPAVSSLDFVAEGQKQQPNREAIALSATPIPMATFICASNAPRTRLAGQPGVGMTRHKN